MSDNKAEVAGKTDEGSNSELNLWLARNEKLEKALKRIATWFGEFPPSGHYWDDERTREMSYGAALGSNGERDYMRKIAQDALEG